MPGHRHRKPRLATSLHRLVALLAVTLLAACGHADHGVESRTVQFDKLPFRVVSIDTRKAPLALYWRNPDTHQPFGDIDTLKQWGARHDKTLLFAANAGIYDSRRAPLGLFVENGKTLVPLNTAHGNPRHGNFSLLPNGVFSIDENGHATVQTTKAWKQDRHAPRWATQSGPMLVIDGGVNPHFEADSTSLKWRSGVCARSPNQVIFAISQAPVNFHTFARLFRDKFGCRDALYLDGTLSQFYVGGEQYGPPGFMVKPWAGMFAVFVPRDRSSGH
ncbi:MAG TPA: phosphodiester glycosidase family protein [Rhodanobacteraceae bacterium]|nr:phosphodiester glycosidase family protein [Rhodanobacteraceae bacterium]